MPDEFEPGLSQQVGDIDLPAGEQVVDTNNLMTIRHQAIAEVTAQKSGSAGNQYTHGQKSYRIGIDGPEIRSIVGC